MALSLPAYVGAQNPKSLTITASVSLAYVGAWDSSIQIGVVEHPSLELDLRLGKLISLTPSFGSDARANWGVGYYVRSIDVGLGVRFWPFRPELASGLFCGLGLEQSLGFHYDSSAVNVGLGIRQGLGIYAESGWQWRLTDRLVCAIRLVETLYSGQSIGTSLFPYYPSLGFRMGWTL